MGFPLRPNWPRKPYFNAYAWAAPGPPARPDDFSEPTKAGQGGRPATA